MADEQLFESLGFAWDRSIVPVDVPVHSVERAVFRLHKALPEYVWDAAVLEGNPFTFPDVQTLMDGVTVGGHKLSDERQVVNLVESARELLRLVRVGRFALDKPTSDHLHAIIARDEAAKPTASLAPPALDRSDAFDAGHFRGEGAEQQLTPGVALGQYGRYLPPETQPGARTSGGCTRVGLPRSPTCRAHTSSRSHTSCSERCSSSTLTVTSARPGS